MICIIRTQKVSLYQGTVERGFVMYNCGKMYCGTLETYCCVALWKAFLCCGRWKEGLYPKLYGRCCPSEGLWKDVNVRKSMLKEFVLWDNGKLFRNREVWMTCIMWLLKLMLFFKGMFCRQWLLQLRELLGLYMMFMLWFLVLLCNRCWLSFPVA